MIFLPRRIPIPNLLHSSDTNSPFETCLVCERPLLETDTEYVIEKAFRRYDGYDVEETIFEYALCLSCHDNVVDSFSDASKQACDRYFEDRVDVHERSAQLLSTVEGESDADVELSPWLNRCVAHDTPADDLREWQVLAHCAGDDLILSHMPLLIGGKAIDEIVHLLSNETLDELGGFRDEHFGLPPEFQQTPSGSVLV